MSKQAEKLLIFLKPKSRQAGPKVVISLFDLLFLLEVVISAKRALLLLIRYLLYMENTHVFMWDRCTVYLFCFAGAISISNSTLDRLQILHAIGYPHFNAYHSDTFYRAAVLYISIHRADNFLSNDAPLKKFR